MSCLPKNNSRGFTIVELLIAMAVGFIVLGAVYSVFILQNKTYKVQEQVAEMQQNARAGMDIMTGEIMMAGYNPAGAAFDGMTYSTSQLQIRADLNGDGAPDDSSENIIYSYDTTNLRVNRDTGGGSGAQPLLENVQAFSFQYLDGDGNATTTTADIRQVRITITMRTSNPDPDYTPNSGYRTYVLTSVIIPRNLGL